MNEKERANDPVMEWLGAYLDGELAGERLSWVERHLAGCPACQRELENLRALSSLLHADPEPAPAHSMREFSAQVLRGLAERGEGRGSRIWRTGLRYTPLGLFAAWAFCQAVIVVSGALLFGLTYLPGAQALFSGLLPLAGSGSGGYLSTWLAGPLSELGLSGMLEAFGLLRQLPWLNTLALASLGLAMLTAALFTTWLASYWSHCRIEQCA